MLPPELSCLAALEELNVGYSPALAHSDGWRHLERLRNLRAVFALNCGLQDYPCLPQGAILFGLNDMPLP